MSEYSVPTVFVTDKDHPDGYVINESDFNADVHTKADQPAAKPKAKKAAAAPAVDEPQADQPAA